MNTLPPTAFDRVRGMVFDLDAARVPAEVRHFAMLLLLDTLGVAAAARDLDAAVIARETALDLYAARPGGPSARMMFDGRAASVAGAAFAAAAQIDNLDAHDGYNPTKGHLGVVIIPALMSFAQAAGTLSGAEALAALIAGYEVGARAGIALHATVSDYHTSGAWNALGVAVLGVRLRRLSAGQLREALGIAEYHGPRSQMMRVIDTPTMLHDGSAWGALAGATAVFLAERGFTGAPAITVEAAAVADIWRDLGQSWVVDRHYIKPYPVCRWVHALVGAALQLRAEHKLRGEDVAAIELSAFHEATRLYREVPGTTAVAQYAISFPVAAALAHGRLGVSEITGPGLADAETRRLVEATTIRESREYGARFPAGRWGDVVLKMKDGRRLASGPQDARGGPENPLREDEIVTKFHDYAAPAVGAARARALADAIRRLAEPGSDFAPVLELACQS
ncbi:MAG TPA: MmgE/PrpD family protein [Dongiaceae bacterium]